MDLQNTEQQRAAEVGMNLIGELPDALLSLIISRLPFNEAVTTSVLSRCWEHLWKEVSRVEFDPTRIKPWKQKQNLIETYVPKKRRKSIFEEDPGKVKPWWQNFITYVPNEPRKLDDEEDPIKVLKKSVMSTVDERMVSLLLNEKITCCSIIHFHESGIFNFLAKQKNLEDLSLTCRSPYMITEISQVFFHGNKLSSLELANYTVRDGSAFNGCVNLKTLKLSRVCLVDDNITLYEIFHSCLSLENLVLDSCCPSKSKYNEIELIVHNDKLKSLTLIVSRGFSGFRFNVECLNLEELRLSSPDHEYVRGTLEKGSGLVMDTVNEKPIKDLRVLSATMDLNSNRDIIVLAYVLDAWENLWNIDITCNVDPATTDGALPYENDLKFWDEKKLPKCISNRLKIVKIRGFRGEPQEISFASMLIRNASKLQQLVIECGDNCSKTDAANTFELLSVQPIASNGLSIILKPDKIW